MDTIKGYFPSLTDTQIQQLSALQALYAKWNEQINVISRKDIDSLYLRHVLHSLSIAKLIQFKAGTRILDVGTGGGFPGIPLAILFPECQFMLVDSIGKKIKVVNAVADELGLTNVIAEHTRAESIKHQFDFVTARAVTELSAFTAWVWSKIKPKGNNALPNGILCLKGGDLRTEIEDTCHKFSLSPMQIVEYPITDFFSDDFFETKKIIYIQR